MGPIPDLAQEWDKLRGDQKYLYRMVLAVHSGVCDDVMANLKPGPVSQARWLTTASRVLRLYISTREPSKELKKVVKFIVQVYAPFWFLVKTRPQAIHGSRNVHQYITWLRNMPADVQTVVRKSVRTNSYFFHPENILLSMITDSDRHVRARAYEKILELRKEPQAEIRVFHPAILPYMAMVDWRNFTTESPCLQFYTQEQLAEFNNSEEIIEIPGKLIYVNFHHSN